MRDRQDLDWDFILRSIILERGAQWEKWGSQDHSLAEWMLIATEEFGEAAKEACDVHFPGNKKPSKEKLLYEIFQAMTTLANIADMVMNEVECGVLPETKEVITI